MNFNVCKRVVSLIIMFAMMISLVPSVFAAEATDFVDFPQGWSKEAMTHAVDNGLLQGRSATTINPEDHLTRAEMATIINRAFGAIIKADISQYTDVPEDEWYYDEIAKAVNMRTFEGSSDTEMEPDNNITREEVFTVIARAMVLDTEDVSVLDGFSDGNMVSDWARSAVAVLVSNGYVNGNGDNTLCPDADITREEFAQVMFNVIRTYFSKADTYEEAGVENHMIRASATYVKNLTIEGDLVIGEGAAKGLVQFQNVTIKGRLLIRGAAKIRLSNTKVEGGIIVNNYNDVVHFDNYRTEAVFKNIILNTKATFKKRTGGGGSSSGETAKYYTVSFHDGADPVAFASYDINQKTKAENRNLKYFGQTLTTIYKDKMDEAQEYDRSKLGYNLLDIDYNHKVAAEFLYEASPGEWIVFDEETQIDKNIDVYYATKHAMVSSTIEVMGIPAVMELSYDSKSRLADSVKDGMLSLGLTLDQSAVQDKVNQKMETLYTTVGNKTGMVDAKGQILDKDYGLKIVDVISYDKIQAQVKDYIEGMLEGDEDDLRAVISLLDISSLVDTIGGRKLIEIIGVSSIRDMLASEEYAATTVPFIQGKIKDSETAPGLVESVLGSDSKDTLIDTLAANDSFLITLLGTDVFRGYVLDTLKGEQKETLLAQLEKESVQEEILSTVKSDDSFDDMVDLLSADEGLKKDVVKKVAYPGRSTDVDPDIPAAALAGDTKKAVLKIIERDYPQYRKTFDQIPDLYPALVMFYVDGDHCYNSTVQINPDEFEEFWLDLFETAIDTVVTSFLSYDPTDPNMEKPEGYDIMSDYFDDAVIDIVEDYVNGKAMLVSNPETNKKLIAMIEDNIIAFIQNFLAGKTEIGDDPEIVKMVKTVKDTFIGEIKSAKTEDLVEPIVSFLTDPNNKDTVDQFVLDNYKVLVGSMSDEFINQYLNEELSDDEINKLVKEYATEDTIVTYILGLTNDPEDPEGKKKQELINSILNFLNEYKPYKDFMAAFEKKALYFEVNKTNTHFVRAVGETIYKFDFEEILAILKENASYAALVEALGEDILCDMFEASKKDYWEGLEPIIKKVEESSDPDITDRYTTKMNVTINVPLVLEGLYENISRKFREKIQLNGIYDYDKNTALQKLANINWFDMVVAYAPPTAEEEAMGYTGYYFKNYMDYYCSMMDVFILYDQALCFYNADNYTEEEFVLIKESLSKHFLEMLDNMEAMGDRIENGDPIVGSYTLDDLIDKVQSFKKVVDAAGTAASGYEGTITTVIDKITSILEDLGEGDLPGGYTLENLETLCQRLENVVKALNASDYEKANASFNTVINAAIRKLSETINELDQDGTILGRPVDAIVSKIGVINKIYQQYKAQFESIISSLAGSGLGDAEADVDTKKFIEMVFDRGGEDVYTLDDMVDSVKDLMQVTGSSGYDATNVKYVIDKFSKEVKGKTLSLERNFY